MNLPILDRQRGFDEASRNFAIREVMPRTVEEQIRNWAVGTTLDQGSEGACVGFGWTGELLASPRPKEVSADVGNRYARGVYYEAQQIDRSMGWHFSSGATVLSGAKAIQRRGHMVEYRWGFSIEDLRAAVTLEGPVVIGIDWYDSMYRPPASGLMRVNGSIVGGHCLIVVGYHPGMRIAGEDWSKRYRVFKVLNSWGSDWGKSGKAYMRYEDMRDLLQAGGEQCVPMQRKQVAF